MGKLSWEGQRTDFPEAVSMVNATAKPRSSRTSVFQFDTRNSSSLKEEIRSNLLERDYGLQVHHRKTTRDQHNSTMEQVNVTSDRSYFH